MSLIDRIAQAQMNDDEQTLIADRRSVAAAPKIEGFVKSKMVLTRPTEKMIQEYNAKNQQQPIKVINPETGEVRNFKFHPVEVSPEYELEEPLADITNQKATDNFRARKRITEIESILPGIPAAVQEVDDILQAIDNAGSREELVQIAKAIGERPNDMILRTAEVRQRYDDERTRLVDKYRELSNDLPYLELQIALNDQDVENAQAENERIVESNKQKNLMYFNELNRLNSGAFNMSKLPYETDQQYQQRLIDHSQIEAPEQVKYDASIYTQKDFRSHLRNLLNDESKIESVTNSFTAEELSNILGRWAQFEKNYLETFGRNNEYVTVSDLVDFFKNPTTSTEFAAKLKSGPIKPSGPSDNFISQVERPGLLNITNKQTGLSLQIKLTDDKRRLKFGINNEGEQELPPKRRTALLRQMIASTGLTENEFLKAIRSHPEDLKLMKNMTDNIITKYPEIIQEPEPEPEPELIAEPQVGLLTKTSLKMSKKKQEAIKLSKKQEREFKLAMEKRQSSKLDQEALKLEQYLAEIEGPLIAEATPASETKSKKSQVGRGLGYGIKNEHLNNKQIQFGNLEINGDKLWNEHILAVRSKGYMVHNMPSTKISNEFVDLILSIIKGEKVTEHEIKSLKLGERQLYDLLLEKAKIIKELPNTKSKTLQELRDRLEILQGEFEAGNTNPELVAELKAVPKKLHMLKAITGKQLKEFISQFD